MFLLTDLLSTPVAVYRKSRYAAQASVFGFSEKSQSRLGLAAMPRECSGLTAGHGYRLFLPTLMRFAMADSESPFNLHNAYSYCLADPLNHRDDDGHSPLPLFTAQMKSHLRKIVRADIKALKKSVQRASGQILFAESKDAGKNVRSLVADAWVGRYGISEEKAMNFERLTHWVSSGRSADDIRKNFPNTINDIKKNYLYKRFARRSLAVYAAVDGKWLKAEHARLFEQHTKFHVMPHATL